MLRISVLVSGGGTNLQAVMDSIESGKIKDAEIACIISSNPKAFALERGKKRHIKTFVVDKGQYPAMSLRTKALLSALQEARTDLVVLAGYMSILEPELIKAYSGRIINIHPSLIPKYCGKGFFGQRVHEAVIAAGEKESGATVHFVDEGVDTGPIILQQRVPVLAGDTPEELGARVLAVEHQILTEAINKVIAEL
ncbi:phosphoribosylglycinamide formyltransferase [Aminipila luticellarii]|uniref:Phosphoribosylglycinamide formyltransferase n=1 Tax=Aminipila luticellarii TaxID=2507160 RepID=A0A410PYD9_9FIRM|nr:phosphoribosylglycinamide formyltransferase [Aminipila luticellarii]QAT43860.1 phosphoribosylglycinamide formyltransferase [Aminipila luticellarii]